MKRRYRRLSETSKREIVRAFIAGDCCDAVAAQYGCDRSYPTVLAARAGYRREKWRRVVEKRSAEMRA